MNAVNTTVNMSTGCPSPHLKQKMNHHLIIWPNTLNLYLSNTIYIFIINISISLILFFLMKSNNSMFRLTKRQQTALKTLNWSANLQ